jgi:cytochrome P450 family 4 subfamily V
MVHVMQQRQLLPWLQNEFTFALSPLKKEYDEALSTLHTFTRTVIMEKRAVFEADEVAPKGRVAFLDLLLRAVLPDGSKLNDADIQEEVDTFMFEGHDTTACSISWTLYLIGKNPHVSGIRRIHST